MLPMKYWQMEQTTGLDASIQAMVTAAAAAVWAAASRTLTASLDTADITAIKAKTDSLTFTVAGNVDANIGYVNDVEVTGTGADGDTWGPA